MIGKIDASMLSCDNCKEPYESSKGFGIFIDENNMKEDASDDGWEMHHEKDKHYCPMCYMFMDDDSMVLNA